MREIKEGSLLCIGGGLYRVIQQEINGSWKCKCIAMNRNRVSIGDTVRVKTLVDLPEYEGQNWANEDNLVLYGEYTVSGVMVNGSGIVFVDLKETIFTHPLKRFEVLNDETNRVGDIVYFFLDNFEYKVVG